MAVVATDLYCENEDLFDYGLPRGLVGMQGRILEAVTASTDLFELDEHGFRSSDRVFVRATEGGMLAGGLAADTAYYVLPISSATFKLSLTEGGSPVNVSSDGTSMVASIRLPFEKTIEFFSRWVDCIIPHAVPLTAPYPVIVSGTVAELSAQKLLHLAGQRSESVDGLVAACEKRLKLWGTSVPVRDANVTSSSNRAVVSTGRSDPRGWGGTLP